MGSGWKEEAGANARVLPKTSTSHPPGTAEAVTTSPAGPSQVPRAKDQVPNGWIPRSTTHPRTKGIARLRFSRRFSAFVFRGRGEHIAASVPAGPLFGLRQLAAAFLPWESRCEISWSFPKRGNSTIPFIAGPWKKLWQATAVPKALPDRMRFPGAGCLRCVASSETHSHSNRRQSIHYGWRPDRGVPEKFPGFLFDRQGRG